MIISGFKDVCFRKHCCFLYARSVVLRLISVGLRERRKEAVMANNYEKRREKTALTIYNLMLALWVGGIFIYTFLVAPALFKAFGRDSASTIVDKLFPLYFPYILIIVCLALAAFLLSGWKRNSRPKFLLISLGLAVIISLFVNFGLYPVARKVKREISSFETTPADSPARKQFRTLHGISMILNLILLVDGMVLIVIGGDGKK